MGFKEIKNSTPKHAESPEKVETLLGKTRGYSDVYKYLRFNNRINFDLENLLDKYRNFKIK